MGFWKKIFGRREGATKSYRDFWNWFQKHERLFFNVVKTKDNIEDAFFDKVSPKLAELKDGFFMVTGMFDKETAELVFTADGAIANFVFIEELVAAAPAIKGWKFTALKPALDIKDILINMAGFTYTKDNLYFCYEEQPSLPDEIDITIVYDDFSEEHKTAITNGVFIFLDNFIGELNFAGTIDNITVTGVANAPGELIKIEKLKDFLTWREKEFVEKYEGVRHDTEHDNYSMLEAKLESGRGLVAMINTDLLEWDGKASHPWILNIEMKYNGENNNGMPDDDTYKLMGAIEYEMLLALKDYEGNLNIGRQTADGLREVYFACKDFRKPSKVLHKIQTQYADKIEITYEIYKDKYWQSFERFRADE